MTYKEFTEKIKKIDSAHHLNLKVTRDMSNIYVKTGGSVCATVSAVMQCFMSIDSGALWFGTEARQELLEALYELSKTPIDEKQDIKKHYIVSKLTPKKKFKYLCKCCGNIDELDFDVESNIDSKFTQAEIDQIKEMYNTTLDDFEIIEIEEIEVEK